MKHVGIAIVTRQTEDQATEYLLISSKKDFGAFEEPVFNLSVDPLASVASAYVNPSASESTNQPSSILDRYRQLIDAWKTSLISKPLSFIYPTNAEQPTDATPDDKSSWHEPNLDITARLLDKDRNATSIIPELVNY